MKNNYWKETQVQQFLRDRAGRSRLFCCAPKLCMFLDDEDYPARILRPSRAYLILSTCIHVVDKLLKYHACDCKEHVVFNTINWKKYMFLSKETHKRFCRSDNGDNEYRQTAER